MRQEEVVTEECACSTCEGSTQGERQYFIFGSVNTHGICCDFVFTNCQAATTRSRVLEVFNEENNRYHNPEYISEGGHTGNTHQTGSTANVIDVQDADTNNFT